MSIMLEKREDCPDCGASGVYWAYDAQYCSRCGHNALRRGTTAIEKEHARICRAIGHYAHHAPLDLLSAREIQNDLMAICGQKHVHRRSIGSDECDLCGRDLRHEVHVR